MEKIKSREIPCLGMNLGADFRVLDNRWGIRLAKKQGQRYIKIMKNSFIFVVIGLLACSSVPVRAETGTEVMKTVVYPLVFGDPEAMEAVAVSLVDGDGHVVLDKKSNRLIIITTPTRHKALEEMLSVADAVDGNVRVEVRFIEEGRETERRLAVGGGGEVVTGPGGTEVRIELQPDVRYRTTEQSGMTLQSLLVASGREGSLRVGERAPYLEWIMEYGLYHGFAQARVVWDEVGSFLVVHPTILADGETIHIRLTPELRGRAGGGEPHRVRFAGVSTEVIVKNGETFRLGGEVVDRSFYSRFLVGVDRSGVQRSLDMELTPRIVLPGGAGAR